MSTVQEIERAIEELPGEQFAQLHAWIVEKDWNAWDEQVERDSVSGRLDFLLKEAALAAESVDARPL